MPRASAADAALTARNILGAASRCFAERGFHATSVDQIAQTAGVTRGAVYHHFTDKVGLLRAVVRAGHERVASHVVERARARDGDPLALLRSGCHAFVEGITQDEAARVLLIDGPAVLGWMEWRALRDAKSAGELCEAIAQLAPAAEVEGLPRAPTGAMKGGRLGLIERAGDEDARSAVHRALDLFVDAVGLWTSSGPTRS